MSSVCPPQGVHPQVVAVVNIFVCFVSKLNSTLKTLSLKQVGTLDVLVGLSDELAKLDTFVER